MMNRFLRTLLALTPLLVVSGVAFAAGAEHHVETFEEVGSKILFHAINFVLLIALLVWATRGLIRNGLANRAAAIRTDIEASQKLREEAQARFDELQARIDGLAGRISQMEAEAEQAAQTEALAIEERGKREAVLIQEHTERTIRNETERARQALRQEAANIAVELATEQLKSRIGAAENDQLTQQFISAVQSNDGSREVPRG